ncbi:DNA-methyltransferase [Wohlfahrtiimonas chitiniclastica]|uniref:DNA-methyltransferase n=1 Tax=Wohlfahrtiimonas chitiniclastica TaxID=400946 RepID=UPI001BCD8021|nr:site-specific DNA-methyltransferase [Wohlfahrtiimonas chitiniclastica]MBS7838028.1 site-specific DNA-methyltransferase [Wohlfahrtiimonas chitiniclastica]
MEFKFAKNYSETEDIVICQNDTLEALKQIPDESFQLIVSSPPYNIGKIYEKRQELDDYLSWQTEVLAQCVRVLKPTGSLVWQVGNYVESGEVFPLDIFFYPILKQLDLQLRNRIVWHFDHGLHAKNRLSGRYETVLWFTKTKDYIFNLDPIRVPSKYPGKRHYKGDKKGQPSGNPLGKNPSDYWKLIESEFELGVMDIPNVKANHIEKTEHPCQFPVELIERFVLALTNEKDGILDPFGGVGSSAIAALKHNRKAMVIDRDQKYVEITQERIQMLLEGTLKLRPLGKPVHRPTGKEKVAQVPTEWIDNKQEKLI